MLENVYILVEPLDSCLIALVLELLALPPDAIFSQTATALVQEPGPVVAREVVLK